jgi:signal recognition particle subunit SRP68
VPIRNPELVDAFLKVQNVEAATFSDFPKVQTSDGENAKRTSEHAANRSRNKIASYDSVLQAWSDAESIARQLAESNVVSGKNDVGT